MVTLSIQIDNQLCPKSGKQTEIQSANEQSLNNSGENN